MGGSVIRVLLTAVEPFGGDAVNASLEACELLAADPPPHMDLELLTLPCTFGKSLSALRDAIARYEPALVVATGQGANRPDITVERVALNLDDAVAPDNKGNQPVEEPIDPDGPVAYFSSLPVKACVAALQEAGIPASVSHTAGTYICNHIAYGLAHLIATERPGMRGGLVHLPYTPAQAAARERRPSLDSATAARGLYVLLRTAAAQQPGASHDRSPHDRPRPRSWLPRRTTRAAKKSI